MSQTMVTVWTVVMIVLAMVYLNILIVPMIRPVQAAGLGAPPI